MLDTVKGSLAQIRAQEIIWSQRIFWRRWFCWTWPLTSEDMFRCSLLCYIPSGHVTSDSTEATYSTTTITETPALLSTLSMIYVCANDICWEMSTFPLFTQSHKCDLIIFAKIQVIWSDSTKRKATSFLEHNENDDCQGKILWIGMVFYGYSVLRMYTQGTHRDVHEKFNKHQIK